MVLKSKTLVYFIWLLSLIAVHISYSQYTSVENMEVAFLYNFGENIEWKKSDNLKEFKIHYLGDNKKVIELLKFLSEQRKIKGLPITYSQSNSYRNIPSCQILYVDKALNLYLKSIIREVEGTNTLIVTQDYEDKRSVMINFFINENDQIQFEINKPNLIIEGLQPGPNLMLHGGTEIDIAKIYKQNKERYEAAIDSLDRERKKVESFRRRVSILQSELKSQIQRMQKKQGEINALSSKLENMKDTLRVSKEALQQQKYDLQQLQNDVAEKQQTLLETSKKAYEKERMITSLEDQILDKLKKLRSYNEQIETQQGKIIKQEEALSTSNETIQRQRIGLALTIAIGIIILSLSLLLFKANKKKKRAYDLITTQKEKIESTLFELKETQSQLVQAEKMASLGQVTAGIAHEINTPLGAINSSAQNIVDNYKNLSQNFIQLAQTLDHNTFELFTRLVNQKEDPDLSSRDSRSQRKLVRSELEEWGIEDADEISRYLLDLGVYLNITPHRDLLLHDKAEAILHNAYNIKQLLYNSKNITNAVDKASKVVFALKKYSHKDQSEEKVETDLKDNIETVLTIYRNNLRGIRVSKDLPPLSKKLLAYPDELSQVWTNIIYNAIQAMNHDGSLEISYIEKKLSAVVSIKDSGPGIPMHVQPHVFEPFFTTKSRGEGSGLGLDIVKKIVEKHNGEISFQTEIGEGTTFFVELPLLS